MWNARKLTIKDMIDMKDMAKVLFDQNYDRIWNAKAFQELPPQVQKKLKYQINIDK